MVKLKGKNGKKNGKLGNRKTLIFDLDETLVHCSATNIAKEDQKISITLQDGKEVEVNFLDFFSILGSLEVQAFCARGDRAP